MLVVAWDISFDLYKFCQVIPRENEPILLRKQVRGGDSKAYRLGDVRMRHSRQLTHNLDEKTPWRENCLQAQFNLKRPPKNVKSSLSVCGRSGGQTDRSLTFDSRVARGGNLGGVAVFERLMLCKPKIAHKCAVKQV